MGNTFEALGTSEGDLYLSNGHLERCPEHGIYQGMLGCRLCDPTLQPLPE
ncbi:hypothetical protein ACFQY7_08070 [Actinomadura luteofluorescens]|uniref:Uncharacterized protein n=1 Tax=Actinomadura luteofluorescens TaxID=46163 RepID=A0A7Y9EAX3_9ACTN|nr:hypothetical protein [Actinomadura luteofluorescens]NYD44369.1 hypothetical protein [Actinomadura luteofluorescens]